MAEGSSEDSDVGDLLEGMSLTDNQADDRSEHWWKEYQECLQPSNCDGNTSTLCLMGQVHGAAHAHLSKCRFSAGTCYIVYSSNMIMS